MADAEPKPEFADPKLAAAVARLGSAIAANPKNHQAAPPTPPKVYQLPLWPEPVRGTPNSFLRSALFAAIQGKTRRWMKQEFLGALQGVSVRFTGQQLDQSDLDVWEQAVQLARHHPLGHICHFRANAFLTALGRRNGKSDYEWLHSTITRLVACAVEIRSGSRVFTGNLLSACIRDEASGIYKLTLNPKTLELYRSTDWTALQWEQRRALIGKPLALWLHGFYSSHAEPYPLKIATLHNLSGSRTKELWKFKQNLKAALADLEAATGIKGTIEADLVTVERQPSGSQARHIIRKISRRRRRKQP